MLLASLSAFSRASSYSIEPRIAIARHFVPRLHQFKSPNLRCYEQRCPSNSVRCFDVGTEIDKNLAVLEVKAGYVEGGVFYLGDLQLSMFRRNEQRCASIDIFCIDIDASTHEQLEFRCSIRCSSTSRSSLSQSRGFPSSLPRVELSRHLIVFGSHPHPLRSKP